MYERHNEYSRPFDQSECHSLPSVACVPPNSLFPCLLLSISSLLKKRKTFERSATYSSLTLPLLCPSLSSPPLLPPRVSLPHPSLLSTTLTKSSFSSLTSSCSFLTSSTAVSNSTLGLVDWTFLSQPSASKSHSCRTCSHSCVTSSSASPLLRLFRTTLASLCSRNAVTINKGE